MTSLANFTPAKPVRDYALEFDGFDISCDILILELKLFIQNLLPGICTLFILSDRLLKSPVSPSKCRVSQVSNYRRT